MAVVAPLLRAGAGKNHQGRNAFWGAALAKRWRELVDTQFLLFAQENRHTFYTEPRVLQWDAAPVAHRGGLLDNAPFLASLPFLSHFPTASSVFPEMTAQINYSSSLNYSGLNGRETTRIYVDFFQ